MRDKKNQGQRASAVMLWQYVAPAAASVERSRPSRRSIRHSVSLTGQTDRRDWRSSAMPASSGTRFISASETGFFTGITGGDIDHAELAARVGRIGIEAAHDLDDADDLLALVRVIEKGAVALLHRPQIVRRLEVAHPVPMGAADPSTICCQEYFEGSDFTQASEAIAASLRYTMHYDAAAFRDPRIPTADNRPGPRRPSRPWSESWRSG